MSKVGDSMLSKWEYVMLAVTTLGVLYLVLCQVQSIKEGFSSTYGNTQRFEGGLRTHPGFDNPPPDGFTSSMSGNEAPSWHMAPYDNADLVAVGVADSALQAPMVVKASPSVKAAIEGMKGNAHAYEGMLGGNNLVAAMSGGNVSL